MEFGKCRTSSQHVVKGVPKSKQKRVDSRLANIWSRWTGLLWFNIEQIALQAEVWYCFHKWVSNMRGNIVKKFLVSNSQNFPACGGQNPFFFSSGIWSTSVELDPNLYYFIHSCQIVLFESHVRYLTDTFRSSPLVQINFTEGILRKNKKITFSFFFTNFFCPKKCRWNFWKSRIIKGKNIFLW